MWTSDGSAAAAPGGESASLTKIDLYREMFEASPVAIALADSEGLIVLANPAYCELVGRELPDLVGRSSREFTHPEDLAQHAAMGELMAAAEAAGEKVRVEKRYVHADGTVRWGWVSAARAAGPAGQTWTLAVIQDTTERRGAEEALADAASTDALTGLLNRRGWRERLRAMPTSPRRITLAVLDLDSFKSYNDTRGHVAGDALLCEFATRARSALRDGDILARWGGEEFALAVPHAAGREPVAMIARLAGLVPDGQTLSAGYATVRPGESLTDCWDRADTLLYRAKRAGRNRIVGD